ncbi:LysR family transcriptional regulator [Streptomyces sp. TS71-3]|uniref:LysR family transcriptional regulator n=1 Tax=Streptomyces sp. TS71-3 TaxID=2733862 RepID=UPI001B174D88|nr:LysR family transcriptional regulator [Streptomyces sp. TS71-3]GHJ39334.1 LysR family transcriptional regulator [Streptomyces sp. TS71-3]
MLGPHVPDLAGLQMLATVARTGSLRMAALELQVTQQALSQRVGALEARVGIPLLARGPRGSVLTAEGRLVEQWASKVLDAAAELDAGIAALRLDRAGHITVAASLTIAGHLMPRWMVALRDQQVLMGSPVTSVELEATNSVAVTEAVARGDADLGFVEGPRVPRGLRSRTVARDELLVVVALTHPWARRRAPITAAELAATPLVMREAGSGTREALTAALAEALPGTHQADPVLELTGTASVKSAITAGAGPGALSSLAVADDITLGRLRAVRVAGLNLVRDLRAVWIGGSQPPQGPLRDLVAVAARMR